MESTWIQVFILTISECVAPAGKTVCQESQFELEFLTSADCETALEQLVVLKNEADDVIVNAEASSCAPSARQTTGYSSLAAIDSALGSTPGWRVPEGADAEPSAAQVSHEDRLKNLPTCEASQGVAPCKIGSIIMEGATPQTVEVWRRDE